MRACNIIQHAMNVPTITPVHLFSGSHCHIGQASVSDGDARGIPEWQYKRQMHVPTIVEIAGHICHGCTVEQMKAERREAVVPALDLTLRPEKGQDCKTSMTRQTKQQIDQVRDVYSLGSPTST